MRRGRGAAARSGAAGSRARARGRRAALGRTLLAAALALSACATGRRPEPPEPALRLWTPGVVRWSGARRDLGVSVENGTQHTVRVEAPGPRRAEVVLYAGSGPDRVCGHEGDPSGPPGRADAIAPGDAREMRVDLERACGRLPPGEYRYVVTYEAPPVAPGPNVKLRPSYGHVIVEAPPAPPLEPGSLGAGGGEGQGEGDAAPRSRSPRTRR